MLHKSFDNVDIYLWEFIKYKVTAHYNITNATLATDPRFSGRGHQSIIWPKFAENCIKMMKIGPGGCVSKILLYRSATANTSCTY